MPLIYAKCREKDVWIVSLFQNGSMINPVCYSDGFVRYLQSSDENYTALVVFKNGERLTVRLDELSDVRQPL